MSECLTPAIVVSILRDFNDWRRGAEIEQPAPAEIGRAIDAAIEIIEGIDAERGKEAVEHQYQDREGNWNPFINERHYENTVKDGTWPIRALYAAPPPAIPEGWTLVPIEPSERMLEEARVFGNAMLQAVGKCDPALLYKAMLAAAKEPK